MPLSGFGFSIMLASQNKLGSISYFSIFLEWFVYNRYVFFPECLGEFTTEALKHIVCFVQRFLFPNLISLRDTGPPSFTERTWRSTPASGPAPRCWVIAGLGGGGEVYVEEGTWRSHAQNGGST